VGLTESSCASHTSPGRVGRAHAVVYGKVPSTSLRSVAATPIVGDMAVRRRSAGGGWPWDDERTSRLQDMPTRAWACHPTPKGVSHHRHSERSTAKPRNPFFSVAQRHCCCSCGMASSAW